MEAMGNRVFHQKELANPRKRCFVTNFVCVTRFVKRRQSTKAVEVNPKIANTSWELTFKKQAAIIKRT